MNLLSTESNKGPSLFQVAGIKEEPVLSVEEYLNVEKEYISFPELFQAVDELVTIVKKDASIGIDNRVLFKVKPYSSIIGVIDKLLSKRYGLEVVHVAGTHKYQAYVNMSHARSNLIKVIRKGKKLDEKEVNDLLTESQKEIPTVRNGKAYGRREEAKNVMVKADFYDIIINQEYDSKRLTYMILGEMRNSLTEIERMGNLIEFSKKLFSSLQKDGIVKTYTDVLGGKSEDIESKSGIGKMKKLIGKIIEKEMPNVMSNNTHNAYVDKNKLSIEAYEEQATIPFGTRISYVILLMLIVAAISIFGPIFTVSNIVMLAQITVLYVGWMVAYFIYTLIYKIITGHDTKDTTTKKLSGYELLSTLLFTKYTVDTSSSDIMKERNQFSKDIGGSNLTNDVVTNIFSNKDE